MKQYIIINSDLGMSPGKIAGQAAHASTGYAYQTLQDGYHASNKSNRAMKGLGLELWFSEHNQRKIIVKLGEEQLIKTMKRLDSENISYYSVRDMGATEVPANSLTAIAIEPLPKGLIPKWFSRWRLL